MFAGLRCDFPLCPTCPIYFSDFTRTIIFLCLKSNLVCVWKSSMSHIIHRRYSVKLKKKIKIIPPTPSKLVLSRCFGAWLPSVAAAGCDSRCWPSSLSSTHRPRRNWLATPPLHTPMSVVQLTSFLMIDFFVNSFLQLFVSTVSFLLVVLKFFFFSPYRVSSPSFLPHPFWTSFFSAWAR